MMVETAQPGGADYTMTRDEDRPGVVADSLAYGAGGRTDLAGQLAISDDCPDRNLA